MPFIQPMEVAMTKLAVLALLTTGSPAAIAQPATWEPTEVGQTAIVPMRNAP